MLKLFPQQADDLLDVAAMPSTENNELNYRPRPLTSEQEQKLTSIVMFFWLPPLLLLAMTDHAICSLHPLIDLASFLFAPVLLVWLAYRYLTGALVRLELIFAFTYVLSSMGALIWDWVQRADDWAWRVSLGMAWVLSALVARQVASWILVAPTVDHETMKRWRFNVPSLQLQIYSLDCPELLTFFVSPILVCMSWFASAQISDDLPGGIWVWPFVFVATSHVVWFGWHAFAGWLIPCPDVVATWKQTWQALVVFVSYDVHRTAAAGVFRFPARWLRNPWSRWTALLLTMLAISFSFAAWCPHPVETLQHDGVFLATLIGNWLLTAIAGPVFFCTILWLTAGTVLAKFQAELSHHKNPDSSEWDNYVDRLVNSEDELEREHLFIGTCEKGDYPILVHREIHDQHAHILGDSGASKTALGIAPQVTQKIARADSTVIVVDLKGDKALFETCRREAARTKKLKFRWLSNEVGKTSFGFNPFLQSHNAKLSVEQLTQQLLQGLSLDYGIQYGAGYFTAMNEIVLNNVLKETGVRSFRELGEHLADRRWYSSIGHEDDWKQARHLGALVKRLGGSQPINVVPGQFPDQPEVDSEAIDVANLFEEPQVIYLWLRSAVEPTNAPAIARLFLWSMFTAASHQPQDENRVYFFVDEMQQIISDGIKLIFEQFRDLGGTLIAAHQTAGQLSRQGTDLADTIDSCTAMKQVFRASDLRSLERLEKLSGTHMMKVPTWYQPLERGTGELTERYDPLIAQDGLVRITPEERPRYDRNELLAISSRRHSSLVRFTFGIGYTQFSGRSVPVVSQYHISFDEYKRRRMQLWPSAPGAFEIKRPEPKSETDANAGLVASSEKKERFVLKRRKTAADVET